MNEPGGFEEGLAMPHKLPLVSLVSGSSEMLLDAKDDGWCKLGLEFDGSPPNG